MDRTQVTTLFDLGWVARIPSNMALAGQMPACGNRAAAQIPIRLAINTSPAVATAAIAGFLNSGLAEAIWGQLSLASPKNRLWPQFSRKNP